MSGKTDDKPKKPVMPDWVKFAIGGLSGMMAISVVQPNDLLKTRMQLMGAEGKEKGLVRVAKEIIAKQGVLGLYDGLSAALFRQATYTTTRMGVFNTVLDWHKESYGTPANFAAKLAYGMLAGGAGAFIGTPAEVALIRMTGDGRLPPEKRRNYKNVFNALSRIVREEGVTSLWKGAMPTVSRAMVVNAAQLGTYAQAREALLPSLGDGIFLHLVASMIAGLITTVASLPLDIVKTRIQNAPKGKPMSQLSVAMSIIRNEGALALWSGFLPTYGKLGPHTVFTFIFLEQLNNLYYTIAA